MMGDLYSLPEKNCISLPVFPVRFSFMNNFEHDLNNDPGIQFHQKWSWPGVVGSTSTPPSNSATSTPIHFETELQEQDNHESSSDDEAVPVLNPVVNYQNFKIKNPEDFPELNFTPDKQHIYNCGKCGLSKNLKSLSELQCSCGHQILYKARTDRILSYKSR